MSLFIDVIEVLSNKLKVSFNEVIARERKSQERSVRKICDVCNKYLDYGELRYDKMESGINQLQKTGLSGNALSILLFAILNESLDEDAIAITHLTRFSDSSLADPFRSELSDFIAIGKLITLKEYDLLESAGTTLIKRYTNKDNITDTLSNLYLKTENEKSIPVFQQLLVTAKELYPTSMSLESLCGFINMKGKDYRKALESFLTIKDSVTQDNDDQYYNFNMASVWDNIAGCYLKMGDGVKTLESCDVALGYDLKADEYRVGNPILYKKAEAFILMGQNENALTLINQILNEDKDDDIALEIKSKLNK